MRKNGLLFPFLFLAASNVHAGQPSISITNCSPHAQPPGEEQRQDAGPYKLASIRCFHSGKIYDSASPAISPDGNRAAWADHAGITLVDLRSGRSSYFQVPTGSLNFQLGYEQPIAWAPDSSSLWATIREKTKGGFPTSGGNVIRLALDASHFPAPEISSRSGPLDAVQWIPGTSTAIVQFGTHGGTYQPTHRDPAPELAMVDTATGGILDRLPLLSLKSFDGRTLGSDPRFSIAAATAVIAAGRVHALVTIRTKAGATLVRWTQGSPPVELSVPNHPNSRVALLPSGKQLLRLTPLQPAGLQVTDGYSNPEAKRPEPPKPRTGIILEMKSLSTGKSAWSIPQSVKDFWQTSILEISPDGRHALTSWPNRRGFTQQVALIDLRNGATVQMFPMSASGGHAGFTENGKAIWIRVASEFRFYRRS